MARYIPPAMAAEIPLPKAGSSGLFRLGGTLSEQVLLGVESNGWFKSMEGVDNTVGNLSAAIYVYPSRKTGVYGNIPPAEAEARYYAMLKEPAIAA